MLSFDNIDKISSPNLSNLQGTSTNTLANSFLFAGLVDNLCPESREKSLAMTKIEEATMWANASIARREEI